MNKYPEIHWHGGVMTTSFTIKQTMEGHFKGINTKEECIKRTEIITQDYMENGLDSRNDWNHNRNGVMAVDQAQGDELHWSRDIERD